MTQGTSRDVLAWWPVLLAPAVIVLVLLTRDTALGAAVRAHDGGPIPPTIPLAAGVLALAAAWWRGNPLLWVLGALGLMFFLREASMSGSDDHLPGTKKGVYVGLAVLVAWSWVWRDRLRPWIRRGRVLPALVTMWGMYILSQTIARGGLKFISDVLDASGQKLRTPMEESCETVGHLLLLGVVIAACFTPRPPEEEPPEDGTAEEEPAGSGTG